MGWTDLHDSIFREEWDRVRTRLQLELELLDENNLVVGPLAGGSHRDSGGGNSAYDDDDASPSAPVVRSSRSTGGTRETFERDDDMSFPLHLAAQFNAPEDVVVMLLHANPAAAAERDHVGNLPLHCAATNLNSLSSQSIANFFTIGFSIHVESRIPVAAILLIACQAIDPKPFSRSNIALIQSDNDIPVFPGLFIRNRLVPSVSSPINDREPNTDKSNPLPK